MGVILGSYHGMNTLRFQITKPVPYSKLRQNHKNVFITLFSYTTLNKLLTAMYAAQPALRVLALESTSLPEIPKSQSLMLPRSSRRMFEGLTSRWMTPWDSLR